MFHMPNPLILFARPLRLRVFAFQFCSRLFTHHVSRPHLSRPQPQEQGYLAAGAVGVISVCSHVVGPQLVQLLAAWNDGKVEEAQRIYLELLPLMSTLMGVTTSPIPIKAALKLTGFDAGAPRLPLVEATPEEERAIRAALEDAGLL